ncbi:ligand-gated channel protein [Pelistega indica]|uniref:Ligand-gated channel protein n=1 Tax=Pelistega indica TaxID=1414851 RepID=V8FU51_9BURK|nr:TonB-dependent siderophore receptor [Pelistega indica]ETD67665.1 ligand-gated channel protein [Pelistega indica]
MPIPHHISFKMKPILAVIISSFFSCSAFAQDKNTNPSVSTLDTIYADTPDAYYPGGQVSKVNQLGFFGKKDDKSTPFSVINFTEKYVSDIQARDITEIIDKTDPSFFSNKASGSWSENYSIRGFNVDPNDVTVDGLIGMAPFYRTSPELFENIQVLKGPSAILNGMTPKGSVGGVINVMPKRAGSEPLTQLTTSYMSNANVGVHTDIGRRFGDTKQFGIRFNGLTRGGEGSIKDQKQKNQLASLSLDWTGEKGSVLLTGYYSKNHVDGVNRGISSLGTLERIPSPPDPDTLLTPDWSFVRMQDKAVILSSQYNFNDRLSIYGKMGHSKSDYHYNGAAGATINNSSGTFTTSLAGLGFDVEKTSADVGVRGNFMTGNARHEIALNTTYYHHDQNEYGGRSRQMIKTNLYNPVWGNEIYVEPSMHILKRGLTLKSIGFVDNISLFDDKLQFTLGLRHQQVIDKSTNPLTKIKTVYDESATIPAFAILYKVTPQVSVYANYMEGLSQGASAPLTAANAGEVFAPYKTNQMEAGVKFDIANFSNTISIFEIKKPSSYTDPNTNIFSFGGEQRNRGLEWTFVGEPIEHLRLMGGLAFIQPKLTKTAGGINQGNTAPGMPTKQAKLGIEWDTPFAPGLTLMANATWSSKQYFDTTNKITLPSKTIFDVGARYQTKIAGKEVTVRALVNNVTNKAYWGQGQVLGGGSGFLTVGQGRTFLLSSTINF